MSKNENGNVVWQLSGDAITPSTAPWGFIARNPLERAIPAGQKMQIDLQVQASVPMLAFPTRAHADDVQVSGQPGAVLVSVGSTVTVVVENKSSIPLVVGSGEGLVCLHPLVFNGTSEVG